MFYVILRSIAHDYVLWVRHWTCP